MDNLITFEVDGNELIADFNKKKYYIQFRDYEKQVITSEIPEDIFLTYLQAKNTYKSNENEESRHWEHITLSDNELYHRAILKEQQVEDIVIRKERDYKIHKSIELLSESQRNKIIKYYYEDKNMIEISKENNISKQAVSKSLKESYKLLKQFLKNF